MSKPNKATLYKESVFAASSSWQTVLQSLYWKKVALLSLLLLVGYALIFSQFLDWQELRDGYSFSDPILALFSPQDFSTAIFTITYGGLFAAILFKLKQPNALLQLMQAYLLLLVIRTVTLWAFPLYAAPDIIVLQDPFLDTLIYGGVKVRDLFFSGHTATIFLLAFTFDRKIIRGAFALAGAAVGVLLIWQHVHYSIDVFAAPAFAFFVLWIQRKVQQRLSTVS